MFEPTGRSLNDLKRERGEFVDTMPKLRISPEEHARMKERYEKSQAEFRAKAEETRKERARRAAIEKMKVKPDLKIGNRTMPGNTTMPVKPRFSLWRDQKMPGDENVIKPHRPRFENRISVPEASPRWDHGPSFTEREEALNRFARERNGMNKPTVIPKPQPISTRGRRIKPVDVAAKRAAFDNKGTTTMAENRPGVITPTYPISKEQQRLDAISTAQDRAFRNRTAVMPPTPEAEARRKRFEEKLNQYRESRRGGAAPPRPQSVGWNGGNFAQRHMSKQDVEAENKKNAEEREKILSQRPGYVPPTPATPAATTPPSPDSKIADSPFFKRGNINDFIDRTPFGRGMGPGDRGRRVRLGRGQFGDPGEFAERLKRFKEAWAERKAAREAARAGQQAAPAPLAPGQAAPVPPAAPPTDNAAPFNGPPPAPLPAAGGLAQPSTNAFPNNQPAPQPPVAQPAAPAPLPAAAVGAAPQPAAAPAAPTTPAVSPYANFGGGLRLRNYRGLRR